MIKNYFKIMWRNLLKDKAYSFINLSGLTIGMTCFILIALFIQYETSFDKQHKNSENIYRVLNQQYGNVFKGTDVFAVTPFPLHEAMKNDFSETKFSTTIEQKTVLINKNEVVFNENGISADQSLFDVFTIEIIEGIGRESLSKPQNILLTETLAKKFFGNESPLEQTIYFRRSEPYIVKGVISDPPKNQHFKYSFIASFSTDSNFLQNKQRWDSNCCYTYVVLNEGTDVSTFTEKLSSYKKLTAKGYESLGLKAPRFFLQPIKDIHLRSHVNMEIGTPSNIRYIYLFGSIALIILLLASINYMNLAIARSALRAKEVGITKVLGAKRSQLLIQFTAESFLLTIVSFLLALGLSLILMPIFNDLLDKNIPFSFIGNNWLLVSMIITAIFIGSLSGLYPAVFLSAVSPAKAFKGNFLKNTKGSLLRNGLVIGQFTAAIILAIGSVIIYQQLQFVQNKSMGYNREHVIHVAYNQKEVGQKEAVIKAQLLSHPKIDQVSISNQIPVGSDNQGFINNWEGNTSKEQLAVYRSFVDDQYIDLFDMEMVEGRKFSKEFTTDKKDAYIINQATARALGWKTSVGKKFDEGTVIGVVKDYHLQKFDLSIEPMYIKLRYDWQKSFGQVIMKINTEHFEETKDFITKTMNAAVPMVPFEVKFLDTTYAQLYDSEKRLGDMLNIFTILALFIACMGLFGLVSHSVLQRTKEIGIRKVLGSSTMAIITLISKDFLKLVLIALLIASPFAYYFTDKWLQDFAYKIDINWWVFIWVGCMAITIAMITISFQSFKAAKANPINSLKTE